MSRVQLGEHDFNRVRELLSTTAGLVFDESRRDSLSYSMGERLQSSGCADVDAYLQLLRSPRGSEEMQALLNEVTIQETHFFRNPPQFRALRQHVLPGLVKDAAKGSRRIRVWSAGCSTGEEPYSIAMLLREQLPLLDGWDVQVIATDLSTRALDAARAGRYGARAVSVADPADVERWFVRDGEDFVVRPEVRELVTFRHHNLVVEPPPRDPGESFDLILCRNVTIYFSRDTTRALMTRLHEATREGGYLFLGHSETLWQVNDEYHLVTLGDAFVYRRQADDASAADRRRVLPDRRTGDDGLPDARDRRVTKIDRRSSVWEALTKPRTLSFTPRDRLVLREDQVLADKAATPVATSVDPIDGVRAALRRGAYEEAAAAADAVAAAEPMRADAHYLRGMALANLGRDADALVALRKAVYVDPKAGFAHFLLAGAQSRLGNAAAAARSYRAAAETLGRSADDNVAAELGGRSIAELVEMCWQLSGETRSTS